MHRGTTANPTVRRVGVADYAVTEDGSVLSTSGLGSCLAVCLQDRAASVAGLAHVMLPSAPADPDAPAKYTDTGIDALVEAMCTAGADADEVVAKLAGGSTMFEFDSQDDSIGERNVAAARTVLDGRDVPVVAEDVGGETGRSVRFHGDTGVLVVKSARSERRL